MNRCLCFLNTLPAKSNLYQQTKDISKKCVEFLAVCPRFLQSIVALKSAATLNHPHLNPETVLSHSLPTDRHSEIIFVINK